MRAVHIGREATPPGTPTKVGASAMPSANNGNVEFIWAVLQFGFASVSMMLGNKAAVVALPLPCTLVIIQAIGTLTLLQMPYCRAQMQTFRLETARQWLPIACLFTLMLFTSLKSFVYAGIATVLIFRNIGAILTTIVEYFVRGVVVNTKIIAAEVLIVCGAVIYGRFAVDFSWVGLFWILINVCGQVTYGVLVKRMMDVYPHFKDMSKFSMSMYNNTLALPLVALVLLVQGEQLELVTRMTAVTNGGWSIIALTCFFGFLISTSGFGLQKLVSATSFLVINNLTKFVNILLGIVLLNETVEGMAVGGCLLALSAGFWYSYEQSKL
jgi:drug/metabolite transporter (DMT)-like permease